MFVRWERISAGVYKDKGSGLERENREVEEEAAEGQCHLYVFDRLETVSAGCVVFACVRAGARVRGRAGAGACSCACACVRACVCKCVLTNF